MNRECWYKENCKKYNEDCEINCIKYNEILFLMENSNIPLNKQKVLPLYLVNEKDKDTFNKLTKIKEDINSFVQSGTNLYLFSENTGNGKTTWAIKLLQSYFNEIWLGNSFKIRGLFIHVPTLLNQLKSQFNENESLNELKKLIVEVDLVVWDDIASTKLTDFDHSNLLTFIDNRINNGKSNIYTGNLDFPNIENALGKRLTSRVYNGSMKLKFYSADQRGKEFK